MIGIFQLRGDLTQTIVTSRPITDGVMLCGPQPCCPPPNWRLSGLSCFEYCTRFSVFPSGSPTLRMFPLSDPPPVHFSPIFCFLLLKIDHFNFPSIRFTDYYYFSSAVQIGLRPPRVDCSCQLLYFSAPAYLLGSLVWFTLLFLLFSFCLCTAFSVSSCLCLAPFWPVVLRPPGLSQGWVLVYFCSGTGHTSCPFGPLGILLFYG